MSTVIAKGDTVRVSERVERVYKQAYGEDALEARVVTLIESVSGKKRLHLDGAPGAIWASQAKLVKRAGK